MAPEGPKSEETQKGEDREDNEDAALSIARESG